MCSATPCWCSAVRSTSVGTYHDHLPASRYSYVRRALREAYPSKTFTVAKARLQALAAWLERQGEHGAAASLREGLDETLTVLQLTLPATLRRSLASTNPVENLIGTIRRVSRNVKRWRGDMVPRWTALGLRTAEQKFRRIKGYRDLPVLVRELRRDAPSLDANADAARPSCRAVATGEVQQTAGQHRGPYQPVVKGPKGIDTTDPAYYTPAWP